MKFEKVFTVSKANHYNEEEDDKKKTVQIWIIDILYNNRICSLVYMRDMTPLIKDGSR